MNEGVNAVNGRLDPPDWEAFRRLGHRMVDDLAEHLQAIGTKPPAVPMEAEARSAFQRPLPVSGEGLEAAYEDFRRYVLSTQTLNLHPRFWGWVVGTGRPGGMLTEMLTGALNANVSGGDLAPVWVEMQVLEWCKALLGYPQDAGGILVSGGSMANLLGLAVARSARSPDANAAVGVHGGGAPLVVYASTERHSSVDKAVALLGLGRTGLHLVGVNEAFQIDVPALRRAIRADRAAGRHPIAVVGNAGTVNTGAFDNLEALASAAHDEGIWLHVDGAFGALVAASPEYQSRVFGLDAADSLAFDLHKWLHMPYGVGCLLVRDSEAQRRAFSLRPDYLAQETLGDFAGPIWFDDYGIELSRPFRALSVWMAFKEWGRDAFVQAIEENLRQAQHLADLIRQEPRLRLMAPVPANVVCFRYVGDLTDEATISAVNEQLVLALILEGVAVVSSTKLHDVFVLRVAITNHRTRLEDMDLLVRETVRIGDRLSGGKTSAGDSARR